MSLVLIDTLGIRVILTKSLFEEFKKQSIVNHIHIFEERFTAMQRSRM